MKASLVSLAILSGLFSIVFIAQHKGFLVSSEDDVRLPPELKMKTIPQQEKMLSTLDASQTESLETISSGNAIGDAEIDHSYLLWEPSSPSQMDHPAAQLRTSQWVHITNGTIDRIKEGDVLSIPLEKGAIKARIENKQTVYGNEIAISASLINEHENGFMLINQGSEITIIQIRNGGENYFGKLTSDGGWLVDESEFTEFVSDQTDMLFSPE